MRERLLGQHERRLCSIRRTPFDGLCEGTTDIEDAGNNFKAIEMRAKWK